MDYIAELNDQLDEHTPIKLNLELFAEYVKMTVETEEFAIKYLNAKMVSLLNMQQLQTFYASIKDKILNKMFSFEEQNSG